MGRKLFLFPFLITLVFTGSAMTSAQEKTPTPTKSKGQTSKACDDATKKSNQAMKKVQKDCGTPEQVKGHEGECLKKAADATNKMKNAEVTCNKDAPKKSGSQQKPHKDPGPTGTADRK